MTELLIMEPEYGVIARRLRKSLTRRNAGDITVYDSKSSGKKAETCDILVISAEKVNGGISENVPRCGILLLPAGYSAPVSARSVVTYGMSPKSTLTLSSIGEENCVLALLREIVTADGGVLDRQEMKIKAQPRADDLLAVSGALLLLGFLPD